MFIAEMTCSSPIVGRRLRCAAVFLLAAVVMDTHVAADMPAGTSRVRRVDRDADADQPAARESTKRRAAQRW